MFKKSIPIIFVGLCVVIIMIVFGWSVFMKTEVPVQVEPPVVNDNSQNIESEEVADDSSDVIEDIVVNDDFDSEIDISDTDISKWKTYRNEEYGFEIEYPKDWTIGSPAYTGNAEKSGNAHHILGMSPDGFEGDWSMLVTVIPLPVDEILEDDNYYWNKGWEIANKEDVLINNISAQKVTWSNSAILIYFQKPDSSLTIQFDGCYNEWYNTILSTFKFIK